MRAGTVTMQSFIEAWRERVDNDLGLAPASKLRREIALKALLRTWPGFWELDPTTIRESDCLRWAAGAYRRGTGFVAPGARTARVGMSPSAFNKCVDCLRGVLELCVSDKIIAGNPASAVSKVRARRTSLELPSTEQFEAIVRAVAAGRSRWARDCADLVRLLAYSGARLREATALRWSHLDEARGRLAIPGTKSSSSYRWIPLFPALGALLAEMRARRAGEPRDAPIARVKECCGSLRSACRATGASPLTHHRLRHLFATRCIESGVDIPTVSRWLGHSDGGALALKTYGHLRDEHSATQAAKVRF